MKTAAPSPTMRRGAKSRANLKRTAGPGRPKLTPEQKAEEKEVRRISKKLLNDPKYQESLKKRLLEGRLQPGVEVMLWYFAFGKPPETIETKQVTPIRIENVFAKDDQ